MLLTKEKSKIVYVGYKEHEIVYIGRGDLSRASLLLSERHHSEASPDKVEILGPYSYQESRDIESQMILKYKPKYNKYCTENIDIKKYYTYEKKPKSVSREPSPNVQMIIDDLQAGDKQVEIAKRYGVTRQYITNIKKRWMS